MEPVLAIVHFLLVISVGALLLAEFVILRLDATPAWLRLLGNLDLAYGVAAVLVIGSGLSRVFWGDIPAATWGDSHLFWTKMAVFGVIGGLSVIPTMTYFSWKARFASTGVLPTDQERKKTLRWVHIQLGLFVFLPILAVLMAQAAESHAG